MLWISVSLACDELKQAILAALRGLRPSDRDGRIQLQAGDAKTVLALLEKALADSDCVAVENVQDESEIAVLKKGDIERNIHQRVHYIGFG